MKIREAVRPELVFLGLEAESAREAIGVVSSELAAAADLRESLVDQALTEREKLGSTSVGNGFAIPHCKLADLEEIVVALARFDSGVEFGGNANHEPVRFFFVVLSPPDQPGRHLQVLSQIARILKNDDLREDLLSAADADSVSRSIQQAAEREGL
jgi:PTS system nitrogen regulatory IIA component